jgi:hypothetical protein
MFIPPTEARSLFIRLPSKTSLRIVLLSVKGQFPPDPFPGRDKKITRRKQRFEFASLSPTAGEIVHVSRRTYLKAEQELHETAKMGDPQINSANHLLDLRTTIPQLWHFADL